MKVLIDEESLVYLESDPRQFILREYNGDVDSEGREVYKNLGYFSDLNAALRFIIQKKIRESDAETIEELIEEVKALREYIDEAVGVLVENWDNEPGEEDEDEE
ncbi:hypothetical protein D1872_81290 [compost metagenome]